MSNPVYQQLKQGFGSNLDVTPEQVEAYTRFKYMQQVYARVIVATANSIWKDRYAT
jgi:hypothetical protein